MVEGQDGHYSTTVIRRAQKGRLSALRDDPNKVVIVFFVFHIPKETPQLLAYTHKHDCRDRDLISTALLTTCSCLRVLNPGSYLLC